MNAMEKWRESSIEIRRAILFGASWLLKRKGAKVDKYIQLYKTAKDFLGYRSFVWGLEKYRSKAFQEKTDDIYYFVMMTARSVDNQDSVVNQGRTYLTQCVRLKFLSIEEVESLIDEARYQIPPKLITIYPQHIKLLAKKIFEEELYNTPEWLILADMLEDHDIDGSQLRLPNRTIINPFLRSIMR